MRLLCHREVRSIMLLTLCIGWASAELFTLATAGYMVGAAMVSGGAWFKWGDAIKDNTVCRFTECCNSEYVPYNIDALRSSLSRNLFGQPLVAELANILEAHKASIQNESSLSKAEVISLHGWTGVGKNYAANMVADALYKKGTKSGFVKSYQGQKAIDSGSVSHSRERLYREISSTVRRCPKSLIIFDEVHDMDPGILDRIKPMLDHHREVDGVDYRSAVFIFISNIGGHNITDVLLELYSGGMKREKVEFQHFEPIIRKQAFFTGGFNKAAIISHHLIDHYVPFLPLEQQHVEQCARAEFRNNNVTSPTKEMMEDALSVIAYGPNEKPIFSNNGCRRFSKHIPFVIQKHKQKTNKKGRSDL